jgi:hypothetical protein
MEDDIPEGRGSVFFNQEIPRGLLRGEILGGFPENRRQPKNRRLSGSLEASWMA